MWSRIHLTPLLQAEEDRDQIRRYWADKEREKELLGAEVRVYHSDRYVSVAFFALRYVTILPVVFGVEWFIHIYTPLVGNAR